MLNKLYQIYKLFDYKIKKRIIFFQIFILISSFLEVVSFGSLIPFFSIIADPELINSNDLLYNLKQMLKIEDNYTFVKIFGFLSIILILVSNLILLVSIFAVAFFGQTIGMSFSHQIYKFYLNQKYTFFTNNDSSYLSARIINESIRIADGVITASLIINSRVIFSLVIIISLLLIDYKTSLIIVLFFGLSHILIYLFIKRFITRFGHLMSLNNQFWFKNIQESFNAIKELIVLNRLNYYDKSVEKISKNIASYKSWGIVLGQSPRYLVEAIAFVFILVFLSNIINDQNNFLTLVPYLALYGIAGYKLLPTFQYLYYHYNHLKFHIAAYDNLKEDLENMIVFKNEKKVSDQINNKFTFNHSIEFNNVNYSLSNNKKSEEILQNINLKFYFNELNAIIGHSGSGKTTLIDLLLGLRLPTKGDIKVDGVEIKEDNLYSWRDKIGYVPQKIFIINGNIIENICIGMDKKVFNQEKAIKSLNLAGLAEFSSKDENGLYRQIGEKGMKLSGGQIQRIGIARSLYNDPEVLIFDEVTSSLDAIAERNFYETISQLLSCDKTIIVISHKVDYLSKAYIIHLIKDTKVYNSGTFKELQSDVEFQKLLINSKYNKL